MVLDEALQQAFNTVEAIKKGEGSPYSSRSPARLGSCNKPLRFKHFCPVFLDAPAQPGKSLLGPPKDLPGAR
jgi:hypothetical protein